LLCSIRNDEAELGLGRRKGHNTSLTKINMYVLEREREIQVDMLGIVSKFLDGCEMERQNHTRKSVVAISTEHLNTMM
jgi:hypothetical protein